jgi:hypothetical protein
MTQMPQLTGTAAEIIVAYRFLEAGRMVSWPLAPCAYDLVVDAGDRFYRVQVKQARLERADSQSQRYVVGLRRRHPTKPDRSIAANACDIICVVCTPDRIYVIPESCCRSPVSPEWIVARLDLGLEGKYAPFLNTFALGLGESHPVSPVALAIPQAQADWRAWRQRRTANGGRKAHKRLTPKEIEEIRQIPIAWYKGSAGLLPAEVASRYAVSAQTLRNIFLYGKRKSARISESSS